MFNLSNIYSPITAQPFMNNETYIEIQPCDELKPYICCFWGTPKPYVSIALSEIKHGLVIPDTCMDIIFNMNLSKDEFSDIFCGINDTSFTTQSQTITDTVSCFAIRFYFWAVPMFADESMKNSLNKFVDVDGYFKNFRHYFENILRDNPLIHDRITKSEQYLLKRLDLNRQNNNVMNAVYGILKSKGAVNISELVSYTAVSQRQLERLFLEYVGITPKKLSGLVRYQYLWQDILNDRSFNVQDAVYRYKYTDQAHLLNDFKKYHTIAPKEAKAFAYNIR